MINTIIQKMKKDIEDMNENIVVRKESMIEKEGKEVILDRRQK